MWSSTWSISSLSKEMDSQTKVMENLQTEQKFKADGGLAHIFCLLISLMNG
jgi:hypothetical protein